MTNYKDSIWFTPALLIVTVTVTLVAGVPIAHATETAQVDDEEKIEIRVEEEETLKEQDTAYARQAKILAEQYRERAELVADQGGDPKPLLDAAAYFEEQSRIRNNLDLNSELVP